MKSAEIVIGGNQATERAAALNREATALKSAGNLAGAIARDLTPTHPARATPMLNR